MTPTCPRCCCAPLRFVPSGDCLDSTGGGTYRCVPCGYSTARDLLVEDLLRELRDVRDLLKRFGRMALPGFVRELVAPEHRCPECEAKWRQAVVDAVQDADALHADDADGTGRADAEFIAAEQLGFPVPAADVFPQRSDSRR